MDDKVNKILAAIVCIFLVLIGLILSPIGLMNYFVFKYKAKKIIKKYQATIEKTQINSFIYQNDPLGESGIVEINGAKQTFLTNSIKYKTGSKTRIGLEHRINFSFFRSSAYQSFLLESNIKNNDFIKEFNLIQEEILDNLMYKDYAIFDLYLDKSQNPPLTLDYSAANIIFGLPIFYILVSITRFFNT